MEINVPINNSKYNRAFVTVINSLMNLTKAETDVITAMLDTNHLVLDTDTRKAIRAHMNKDEIAFNNIVCTLKKSGTLIKTAPSRLALNPKIIEGCNDKSIKINFYIQ